MAFCCFDQVDAQMSYALQVQVDSKICVEWYLQFYLRHLHMKYKQLLSPAIIHYGNDVQRPV